MNILRIYYSPSIMHRYAVVQPLHIEELTFGAVACLGTFSATDGGPTRRGMNSCWPSLDSQSPYLERGQSIGLHTRKIFPGFKQSKYAGGWFHWHDWAGTDLSIPREIWSRLSERIVRDGLFNSQFIALMPTSGCAQVTGCSDAFYPFYANASTKVTNKEEALRPNRSFWRHVRLDDREALNLVGGRVSCLPEALRQRYLRFQTAFDYNQEDLIQMSRDRAPFVDQSQSHSLFLREEHRDELETRVSAFAQSPAYERIVSSGYLSALRYYDTYLYVGRSGKQESVQHFYMRLAGFCAG